MNNMNMNEILMMIDLLEGKENAIEMSESREQKSTINADRLPLKTNGGVPREYLSKNIDDSMEWEERMAIEKVNNKNWTKEQYEKMGIKIIDEYDDLFYSVELPDGWKTEATDHSMWNNLIDSDGRRRATFFYKGAFYDRDAFSNFERRYSWNDVPFDEYKTDATYEERKAREHYGKVYDGVEEIFSTDKKYSKNEKWFENDEIQEECLEFLNNNYPNWKDINSYWE